MQQIFHPTEPRVIGILDWELCTLGSPLADLGNLLLPFSFVPISPKDLEAISGPSDSPGGNDKNKKQGGGGASSLMVGLKGLSSSETGLPESGEIESWWVEGMNDSAQWHNGGGCLRYPWKWPIQGMG